ncbi:hypothetical protein FQR65_LT20194 [Abscondita terminalis]|nr:hypothetical protein FQR65_LT20194 [Abscondita terminalis]
MANPHVCRKCYVGPEDAGTRFISEGGVVDVEGLMQWWELEEFTKTLRFSSGPRCHGWAGSSGGNNLVRVIVATRALCASGALPSNRLNRGHSLLTLMVNTRHGLAAFRYWATTRKEAMVQKWDDEQDAFQQKGHLRCRPPAESDGNRPGFSLQRETFRTKKAAWLRNRRRIWEDWELDAWIESTNIEGRQDLDRIEHRRVQDCDSDSDGFNED